MKKRMERPEAGLTGCWERPEEVYNRKNSYKFRCSVCKGIVYQVTGNNGRKNKENDPGCTYPHCPWCLSEINVKTR